jgi:tricorn protease
VVAGEYLLTVNGRELRTPENVYVPFEGTAGKITVLRVGPNPDGTGSREATVVPIPDESRLRNLAWVEDDRRKVDQATHGRVAYIYMPDTAFGGYTNSIATSLRKSARTQPLWMSASTPVERWPPTLLNT